MIQSMTGYGKATGQAHGIRISVEIKSLNSKSLELNLKVPQNFKDREQEIRTFIQEHMERGKIDATIVTENGADANGSVINKTVVKKYISELKELSRNMHLPEAGILQLAVSMPNALSTEKPKGSDGEWKQMKKIFEKAFHNFRSFRIAEGKMLASDIHKRINKILENVTVIERNMPVRINAARERIKKLANNSHVKLDENRFEQELIYYFEKLDVTEEIVRLRSHCAFFLETMKSGEPNGKKLGFITQEMGREINTIGSKVNDAKIQRKVVEMKDDLEKIKEQTANIL